MVRPICPTYTLPLPHGIQCMPETLMPRSPFNKWALYLVRICTVLMLKLARTLLILFGMVCIQGTAAIPVGFSCCESDFDLEFRVWWMSIVLQPFHMKVFLRCTISSSQLIWPHRVLAHQRSAERTACFVSADENRHAKRDEQQWVSPTPYASIRLSLYQNINGWWHVILECLHWEPDAWMDAVEMFLEAP